MAIYGLYTRDLAAGDLVWFTSNRSLAPGAYTLSDRPDGTPEVHVAESILALVSRGGGLIQRVEQAAKRVADAPFLPAAARERVAEAMTAGLLERLHEISDIWGTDPPRLQRLRHVGAGSA
jgi:hypothetical protein